LETEIDLVDRLADLTARARALMLAIEGLDEDENGDREALAVLAADLAREASATRDYATRADVDRHPPSLT
jgi:hypothetical protein